MIKRLIQSILVISFMTSSAVTWAKDNLLLHCLAREEEALHKAKMTNSLYRLNQNFLNEIATNNDISIKKIYIDEICNSKNESPSIGFLRLLLLKESDIYDLSLSEVDGQMRSFKMGYINEFQKQVPHMLINYLSSVQAEQVSADCLKNAIPEISFFNEKLKYLEDEVPVHQIMSDKKKIETIFNKLRNIEKINKDCELKKKKEIELINKNNQEARTGK